MSVNVGSVDMTAHSSIGCGAVLKNAVFPENMEELDYISQHFCDDRFIFIGGCTNTLVRACAKDSLYVFTEKLKGRCLQGEKLTAFCGEKTANLSAFCYRNGLQGLENFCLLPGSIGGAVYGNSGCHGAEVSDRLEKVITFSKQEGWKEKKRENISFSYRSSDFSQEELIVQATFCLSFADRTELRRRRNEIGKIRLQALPKGKSLGSVFKRVDGVSAGYYIEKAGLKGKSAGGMRFSDRHANVIVNDGGGTPDDFVYLVELAEETCQNKFGIHLQREVKILDG